MAYDLLVTAPLPTIYNGNEPGMSLVAPRVTVDIENHDEPNASVAIGVSAPEVYVMTAGGPVTISAPEPRVEMTGMEVWEEIELETPLPVVLVESNSTIGDLEIRAPPPDVLIATNEGSYSSIALTAPRPTITVVAHTEAVATVAITAPSPVVDIETGGIAEADTPTTLEVTDSVRDYKCVVLNTDIWEVTEYTWEFDQLVKFGDTYLAVDSSGIHTIGGDTFNGTLIKSIIETGLDDFSELPSKRLNNLCVGLKSTDDMSIFVILDGDDKTTHEYVLLGTDGKPDASRVKIGKPRQRKYINLKIENNSGCDFDIYDIEMMLGVSERKVQGMS